VQFKLPAQVHKNVLTTGIPESALAELIHDWEMNLPSEIKLAYLPSPERIRLRLSMTVEKQQSGEDIINKEIEKLKKIIPKYIYGYGDIFLQHAIGRLLTEKDETLSTAESCTGGNIARLITSVSGSSKYFKGATIAYSNDIKADILHISHETIEKFGSVSRETVELMAKNQRLSFKTDYAVAVSGIAGPEGGTPEKPVGTTWIAVAGKERLISMKFNFGNKRDTNIRYASTRALDMLRKFILDIDD
jgi:nicotinamide-nucleotide amidase